MRNLLLIFMFFHSSAYSFRDEVGNGGGFREGLVAHTLVSINNYINTSIYSNTLTNNEVKIVFDIQKDLEAIRSKSKLIFSEDTNLFLINQRPRLAVTGKDIGAPIYINTKILYEISLDILHESIVTILVHELAHLVGYKNHTKLDLLGAKVAKSVFHDSWKLYLNFPDTKNYLYVVNFTLPSKRSNLIHVNEKEYIDLTSKIISQMPCETDFVLNNLHINEEKEIVEARAFFSCFGQKSDSMKIQIENIYNTY